MLKILTVPAPHLTTVAKPIKKIDQRIKTLVSQMEKTLIAQQDPPGVGLAAPQIGQNLRLFIIKINKRSKTEIFINPRILTTRKKPLKTVKKKGKKTQLEGCLSIPHIWSPLPRPQSVTLEYENLNGQKMQKKFERFSAVVIQHEIDHLDGILFTKRATERTATLYEEKSGKLHKLTLP